MSISSKIKSHLPHDKLSVKFWKDDKLKPQIREQLLRIADAFIRYVDVDMDVVDITVTGSYANYNYTPYSDIDLHVIIDPKSINRDTDLVEEFLKAKRQLWNEKHDIRVLNIEVELYPQDIGEPHRSTGVYTLTDDKWLVKPSIFTTEFDKSNVLKKVKSIKRQIDMEIEEAKNKRDMSNLGKLIDKIRKMRKSGLEKGGELSDENVIYKILRAEGDVQKLFDMKDNIFDVNLSI